MDQSISETGKPVRILLVEDHESTARVMVRLLNILGHEVQSADSVQGALKAADEHSFDMVISDLGLPDGTGLDLMRTLREKYAALRGIALTGYGMVEDQEASLAAGFDRHMTKPVDLEKLASLIREMASSQP